MARRRNCIFWLAVPLFAQGGGTPVFRSATRLVEATAVVRDRDGNTVGGLTAADFELFDNGKRQEISRFEGQKLTHRATTFVARNSAASGDARETVVLPNHFVAFVIDDENLIPEHMPNAILPALRRIAALRPGDRAAVVSASGRMVVDFTDDREKLRSALSGLGSLDRRETFKLSRLNAAITCQLTYLKSDWILRGDAASLRNCVGTSTPGPSRPVGDRPAGGAAIGGGPPGEARLIATENQVRAFAESIVQAGDRDARNYFAVLAKLIDVLSRMPGERSIVLLSPGMYIPRRLKRQQDEIVAEAVRGRVVIGGVDPRGVYLRDDPDDPSTWADTWGVAETNERFGFMESVTSGTGGAFVRGDNDIDGAIRRVDATPEVVYVLGFSPSPWNPDGKHHTLRIGLKSRGGLTVEGRKGYEAVETADAGTDPAARLRAAFFSGNERREIPVTLRLRTSEKPGAATVLTAIAELDLRGRRGDLTLGVGLFDRDGKLVKDIWKEITLHAAAAGVEIETEFEVAAGRYLVRLLVSDREGGAMGTQNSGVDVGR
jgi:VWFA-related protein